MRPSVRRLSVLVAASTLVLSQAVVALAQEVGDPPRDPAPTAEGEAPPPSPDEPEPSQARMAVLSTGQTLRSVDDEGRVVYRVEDGFDLDQYLFRGPLTFSFDITDSYGPVDEHGHPAPGNTLYGKTMLLTLRAWDVDAVHGEVDDVRFNGNLLVPGQLSGANNQWATDTFDVHASWLRLPTQDNPQGTNTVQIDVDRNNGGWAVEIDWAELRPLVEHDSVRPVVLAHGITDYGGGNARSGMWAFDDFLQDSVPGLSGRTSAPPMTQHGPIEENATILGAAIDELVVDEPTNQVDIVAHSMGGLAARQYAFDHPGRVRNVVMVGTPNGGSELAVALCVLRREPDLFVNRWRRNIAPEFGPCDGPEDGLFQLLPGYVRNVFNRQVPDLHSVDYRTIAGRKGGPGSVLIDGVCPGVGCADDGTVSVASVRWLSVTDPDHPGHHLSEYPTVDRDHMGLIHRRDGEDPLSYPMAACVIAYDAADFCPLPFDLDGTEAADEVMSVARVAPLAVEPTRETQIAVGPSALVEPGATSVLPVDVGTGEDAGLIVFADPGLETSLDAVPLGVADVFGTPALGASFQGPTTLTVTNPTEEPLYVGSILRVASDRTLAISAPALTGAGDPVAIDVTVTGALPGETPEYVVTAEDGSVVASAPLSPVGDGRWQATFAPPASGTYAATAALTGAQGRMATTAFVVSDGSSFEGGFMDGTTDPDGDGLIDTLLVEVPVSVVGAGDYRLAAQLVGPAGDVVAVAGTTTTLDASPGTVTLEFDGREVYDSGVDGPYSVAQATLSTAGMDLLAVADLGAVGITERAAYEHENLSVGDFRDEAIDHDGDGLIDTLRIHATTRSDTPGWYAVNGKLVNGDGTEVARASTYVWLNGGAGALAVDFDGYTIGQTGQDGPFVLRDLAVYPTQYPDGGIALVAAFRTAAYRSGDFVGGRPGDAPPVAVADVLSVEGALVELDGSRSTDDRAIDHVTWDFGDGATATGLTVTHEYAGPGVYDVTLTVVDTSGQATSTTTPVTIELPTCGGLPATIVGDGTGTIVGTAGDDVIVGTAAAEHIEGGEGDDLICGLAGEDVLLGGNGVDRVLGGSGKDHLEGGNGDDDLLGEAGDDVLIGANGQDRLSGGAGDDRLDGGNGDDDLDGGPGSDMLIGGRGTDTERDAS